MCVPGYNTTETILFLHRIGRESFVLHDLLEAIIREGLLNEAIGPCPQRLLNRVVVTVGGHGHDVLVVEARHTGTTQRLRLRL